MNAKIDVVAPVGGKLDDVFRQSAWTPFREETLAFVQDLSSAILRSSRFRQFPELMAFAHEMRKKKLLLMAEATRPLTEKGILRGRGVAVHFAPANVDTIFLYSFLLSLMAGNANIVRISSKPSEQVAAVIDVLNTLFSLEQHEAVRRRVALVRYPHDAEATQLLSRNADLRIIWGGDATVNLIRATPIRPLARDVSFPDRWSFAVLDANAFLQATDQAEIVRQFANDSYWFAQMACSSPRLVVWRGNAAEVQEASGLFYEALRTEADRHAHFLSVIDYVNKRVFEDEAAIATSVSVRAMDDNLVSVVHTGLESVSQIANHCGGGMFIDCAMSSLADLSKILDRKAQTVVSYGVTAEEWAEFLTGENAGWGIDRIVRPGEALSFGPVWDGMSLMREFTRETVISV